MSFSNPNLTLAQAEQFSKELKNRFVKSQQRAIIYKDWNQIANINCKDLSQEEALVEINKTHANIKRIVWY